MTGFALHVRSAGETAVIVLGGELDLASAPELEQAMMRLEASGVRLLIIDLRGLEFIDSTGLGVLVRAHRRAGKAGWRLAVVRGPGQVRRLLDLGGLDQRLVLVDSPEELLRG